MRREPIVLFDNGEHQCMMFDDLVSGEGVQSNQFLITDNEQYLLLDPGGDLTYTPLSMELSKHIPVQDLTYIFASHQDPDIIASLDKWLLHTRAQVICSKLWARFLPHLTANYLALSRGINTFDRIIALPDRGQSFALGKCKLKAVLGFHRRYMAGNKVCRLWAAMVREMDVAMIVPQHGRPFIGAEMINAFLYWIENLECGMDLMGPEDYRLPK